MAATALCVMGASAIAADLPVQSAPVAPVAVSSGWGFTLYPYTWASGMKGDVGFRNRTIAHVDYDFTKIIDTLNFVAMGAMEARYGRFSLSSDLLYLRITDKFSAARVGLDQGKIGLGQLQWTPLAGYAVYQDGRNSFELVAGARYWSIKSIISVDFARFGEHETQRTMAWVDAVGGVRGRVFLDDHFFLNGWALAGGGGSDYMWDVMAGVGYRFNDMFSATAGYRAQQVKFQQGNFVFDVTIQGPMLGMQVNF